MDLKRRNRAEYMKAWGAKHPNYFRNYVKKWKEENPQLAQEQCIRYREKYRERTRKARIDLKEQVLTHYGNNQCACVRCGFADIRALSLDHIQNNGAEERKHRRDNFNSGGTLYYRLRKEGYPLGYQTLCYNCNIIKHIEYLRDLGGLKYY